MPAGASPVGVRSSSAGSALVGELCMPMGLKDVKTRNSTPLKAVNDEDSYAVSPRAPLLSTDLQNNVYLCGEARYGQLGSGMRPASHHRPVPTPQPQSVAGDNSWAVISLGTFHAAAITSQGKLFTWGLNNKGQCGVVEPDPAEKHKVTYYPGPARIKQSTTGGTYKAVACGGEHTIALGSRGVCAWGSNSHGQLGLGAGAQSVVWRPVLITSLSRMSVTQLVCGSQHSLALTAQSQVLAWGANELGQLGLGDQMDRHTPTPVEGLWGLPITRLAAGDAHSLALTTSGQLFAWGSNSHGQCGVVVPVPEPPPPQPVVEAPPPPEPLPAPDCDQQLMEQWKIAMSGMGISPDVIEMSLHATGWRGIEVAVEWLFSHDEAEVSHQLSRWQLLRQQQQQYQTMMAERAAAAAAAARSTSPVLSREIVEGHQGESGRGPSSVAKSRLGQPSAVSKVDDEAMSKVTEDVLDEEEEELIILEPMEVQLQGVRHMAAGICFSVAVLENGDVYSWGLGAWGALGHGDLQDRQLPTWVESLGNVMADRVSCGQFHTAIITRDGTVYGCGRCEAGQLGNVMPAADASTSTTDGGCIVSYPVPLQLTTNLLQELSVTGIGTGIMAGSPLQQSSPAANTSCSDGLSDSDGVDKLERVPPDNTVGIGHEDGCDGEIQAAIGTPSPTKTILYDSATRSPPARSGGVVLHEVVAGGCNTAILLRRHQEQPAPWQVTLLAKLQAAVARALVLQNSGAGPTTALALALRNVARGASLVLSSPAALCAALAVRHSFAPLGSNNNPSLQDLHSAGSRTPVIGTGNQSFASPTTTPRKRPRGSVGSPGPSQGQTPKTPAPTTTLATPLPLPLDVMLLDQLYLNLMELSGVSKEPATFGSLSTEYDQGPAMCELQRYGLQQSLLRCSLTLCEDLMVHASLLRAPERAQVLLAALHCPLLSDAACCKQLLPKLCHAVLAAPAAARRLLVRWWASYPPEILLERLVQPMQAFITKELTAVKKLTSSIMAVIKVLARVEAANQLAGGLLPPEAFYNTLISEKMDVQDHYSAWRTTQDLGGGMPGVRPVTNTSGAQSYACEPDSDPEPVPPPAPAIRMRSHSMPGSASARSQSPAVGPLSGSRERSSSTNLPSPNAPHAGRASEAGSEAAWEDRDAMEQEVAGPGGMRMSDPGRPRFQGGASGLPQLSGPSTSGAGNSSNRRTTFTGSTSELHRRQHPDMDLPQHVPYTQADGGDSPSTARRASDTGSASQMPWAGTHTPLTLPPLPQPPLPPVSRPRAGLPPRAAAPSGGAPGGHRVSNSGSRGVNDYEDRMPPGRYPYPQRMSEPGSPPPGQAPVRQGPPSYQGTTRQPSSEVPEAAPPAPSPPPRPISEPGPFSFCTYPFLLDARAKSNLLHIEARFQMEQTVAHARMEQQLYGQHARFSRSDGTNSRLRGGRASEPGASGANGRTSDEEDSMMHVLDKVQAAEELDDEEDEWGAPKNPGRSASASGALAGSGGSSSGASSSRPSRSRTRGLRGLLAALLRHSVRSPSELKDETETGPDGRAESFRLPRPRECTMPGTHSDMCIIRVRRTHLVEDAFDEITRQTRRDLFKPLRVHFIGEEGIDAGGVKKEFFALLLAEMLRPDYGLMEINTDSNKYWFPKECVCSEFQYQLLGLVLGLAVYNRVLLDFPLPMAAYKKLLGLPTGLRDLQEMSPPLGKSLKQLLEMDGPPGTVEHCLCLTWAVEGIAWGQHTIAELVPGGEDLPVTEENREAYVECLVQYHLNTSIKWAFDAFAKGFGVLCNGPALRLFNAAELERLVCGNPTLDWAALQRNAKYEGGYTANSQVVSWLWDVVRNDLLPEEKKRFLKFFTGSDRAPIGGLGTLRCLIQRAGPDSARLPTSHTCFNTLLLPEYSSRARLAKKLRTAINNAEGFGLE